jgi:hypothetical protein
MGRLTLALGAQCGKPLSLLTQSHGKACASGTLAVRCGRNPRSPLGLPLNEKRTGDVRPGSPASIPRLGSGMPWPFEANG